MPNLTADQITAPRSADNQNQQPPAQQSGGPSGWSALVTGYGHGGALGFDAPIAGATSAIAGLLHGDADISKNYSEGVASNKAENAEAQSSHPYIYGAGNVAGSIPIYATGAGLGARAVGAGSEAVGLSAEAAPRFTALLRSMGSVAGQSAVGAAQGEGEGTGAGRGALWAAAGGTAGEALGPLLSKLGTLGQDLNLTRFFNKNAAESAAEAASTGNAEQAAISKQVMEDTANKAPSAVDQIQQQATGLLVRHLANAALGGGLGYGSSGGSMTGTLIGAGLGALSGGPTSLGQKATAAMNKAAANLTRDVAPGLNEAGRVQIGPQIETTGMDTVQASQSRNLDPLDVAQQRVGGPVVGTGTGNLFDSVLNYLGSPNQTNSIDNDGNRVDDYLTQSQNPVARQQNKENQ